MTQVCEAFSAICDLCIALGGAPLNKHAACWECKVDDRWSIAINGHKETKHSDLGVDVEPFCCYVQYNGWPAGIFDPSGGVIAAGEGANETTFLAAIYARTKLEDAKTP